MRPDHANGQPGERANPAECADECQLVPELYRHVIVLEDLDGSLAEGRQHRREALAAPATGLPEADESRLQIQPDPPRGFGHRAEPRRATEDMLGADQ